LAAATSAAARRQPSPAPPGLSSACRRPPPLRFTQPHRKHTKYKYLRPGIETTFYNAKCVEIIDPFGNRIRFNEDVKQGK